MDSQDSPWPRFGEAITFSFIVFSMPDHNAYTQMSFCPRTPKLGVLKFLKLGLFQLWRPITSCANLWLIRGLKPSCSPNWEISNNMWHVTFMQVNQGNFWLLMVGNQIANLPFDPSFGHNLCFKYPYGSYEPISTSTFQELSNNIRNSSIQWFLTPKISF
jgi:hypothetical protein